MGYWVLAIGYGVLAIGDWLLNMGGKAAIRAFTLYTDSPCLYTLHFTLYTISDSDSTSRL